ncbi:MAG: oligosaccharide flippase family protein, partial [Ruminococcus sp.]|nr:oligosaccharide flippase family protein [Ruminococcus sp.]
MVRRNIVKDTLILTIIQFFLECLSLVINVWVAKKVGSATVGVTALTSSFFNLASTLANGNGFLCTSRFVSEELGKPSGNPNRILFYALSFCSILGVLVSGILFVFSHEFSVQFFHSEDMAFPVKLMALSLPFGGFCACLIGFFFAF